MWYKTVCVLGQNPRLCALGMLSTTHPQLCVRSIQGTCDYSRRVISKFAPLWRLGTQSQMHSPRETWGPLFHHCLLCRAGYEAWPWLAYDSCPIHCWFPLPTESLKVAGQGDDTGELVGENSTYQPILFWRGWRRDHFRHLQGGSRVFSTYAVLLAHPGLCSEFSWGFQNFSAELLTPPCTFCKSETSVVSLELGDVNDGISKEKVANPTGLFSPASGSYVLEFLREPTKPLALLQATDMLHYWILSNLLQPFVYTSREQSDKKIITVEMLDA